MNRMVFGAAADDDTGATDLAGMLADQGLRTVLLIDTPGAQQFDEWTQHYDAAIIGTGSRALTPLQAYDRTRAAVRLLASREPRVIEVKYCSTFDSTAEGNIGPSIDAAMDELGEEFTVALPALPVNGRTTYMGYHFVHGRLLSESPMRNHPLTPMTEPNLVRHLQTQTRRTVRLAAYPVTRETIERARRDGTGVAILDCVSDEDLANVCAAVSDLRLISGSSAPAMRLPALWRERGWRTPSSAVRRAAESGKGTLVVAGSCSEATARQNAWAEVNGADAVVLDPVALGSGAEIDVEPVVRVLRASGTCLVRTASTADDRERAGEWARGRQMSVNESGLAIAYGLARVVRRIVEQHLPAALIIAGGETSGAVCRVLELGALDVGPNIEPGVPACTSLGRFRLPVVLKSGNFGSTDFYGRAARACAALAGG